MPCCYPKAQQVIENFLHDRDNLGRPFRQKSPVRAVETWSGGDRGDGAEDIPPTVKGGSPRTGIERALATQVEESDLALVKDLRERGEL